MFGRSRLLKKVLLLVLIKYFAIEHTIEHTIHDLQKAINSEMKCIHHWVNANKLSIKYKETTTKRPFHFSLTKITILFLLMKNEKVNCIDYLGVKIDDKLTWKNHINHIEGKLSSACGAIF